MISLQSSLSVSVTVDVQVIGGLPLLFLMTAMVMNPMRMTTARVTGMPMRRFMFMLSATTAEANSRSQPSLNVCVSEKAAGLPSEYRVSLKTKKES